MPGGGGGKSCGGISVLLGVFSGPGSSDECCGVGPFGSVENALHESRSIGALRDSLEESPSYMAMGQNLRYLFSRDCHLFKRLLRVTGGTGF